MRSFAKVSAALWVDVLQPVGWRHTSSQLSNGMDLTEAQLGLTWAGDWAERIVSGQYETQNHWKS
jgi:hypothetical protein